MEPPKRNLDSDFAKERGSDTPHAENTITGTAETLATPVTTNAPFPPLNVSAEMLMTLAAMLQARGASPLLETGSTATHASAVPRKEVLRITAEGTKNIPTKNKEIKRPDPNELKDYASASEDSSEDEIEDKQERLKEMLRKKVEDEKILKELNEEIVRGQTTRERPVQEPVRTDRKVILKEPAAMSVAISRKRRRGGLKVQHLS